MGESMGKTSYAVKKRYENKAYTELQGQIDKDIVSKFKTLCDRNGESYNSVVRNGIEKFVTETENLKEGE